METVKRLETAEGEARQLQLPAGRVQRYGGRDSLGVPGATILSTTLACLARRLRGHSLRSTDVNFVVTTSTFTNSGPTVLDRTTSLHNTLDVVVILPVTVT